MMMRRRISARTYANSASREIPAGRASTCRADRPERDAGATTTTDSAVSMTSLSGDGAGRERPWRPPRGARFRFERPDGALGGVARSLKWTPADSR